MATTELNKRVPRLQVKDLVRTLHLVNFAWYIYIDLYVLNCIHQMQTSFDPEA